MNKTETMDMHNLDKINLVPDEGFTDEQTQDGKRKLTCKQCSKTFKREAGVKSHISSVHMGKVQQGIKRNLSNNDSKSGQANKKSNLIDDFEFGPMEHSTQIHDEDDEILDNTQNIDDFCANNLNNKEVIDQTFTGLAESVDQIVFPPDQDHAYLFNQAAKKDTDTSKEASEESSDVYMLRAKVLSLEMTVKENELKLSDKESDIVNAKLEVSELESEVEKLKLNIRVKDELNDLLTAKVNTLEDTKASQETKLKTWGLMIKKLNGELKEVKKGEPKINSDEAIKLKNAVKEKEKKAKDAEKDLKKFVDKIAELENQIKKFDINKYKDANAQLNEKKKEIKSIKDELEKATKRASDIRTLYTRKILEYVNWRLQIPDFSLCTITLRRSMMLLKTIPKTKNKKNLKSKVQLNLNVSMKTPVIAEIRIATLSIQRKHAKPTVAMVPVLVRASVSIAILINCVFISRNLVTVMKEKDAECVILWSMEPKYTMRDLF